ncbi:MULTISPECIES: Veg family protein [Lactobacillales]|uniref:Veg family protein n=4 Tax=Aerococcus TaxID=1375 RepID=A0A1E9PPY0_9LACT|nr:MULTISPECIES: Veg family protein [Lactobacillales]AEA00317.1 hypothetical protein HMPREF9243_1680 [Aerococcus sp. Group 1]KAA9218380.1 hypothetical protein F6I39_07215 [Aerococcus loyolae]KAA9232781.1 hypothetical protein F6I37_06875 [Aerococcus mictus]KAA9241516.1 hypothetical protein F6I34_02735 [Aerococcus urinae]KAA9266939.1 hypothetical protein F6I19_00680 [Aerococcus loyolae]
MPSNLQSIKAGLEENIGKPIQVTQQTGRKRITIRNGILSDTFPAVFVVELDQDENQFERVCYSYTDLLTESIEIEFP